MSTCRDNGLTPINKSEASIWWKITTAWWYVNESWVHSSNAEPMWWVVVEIMVGNIPTNQRPAFGRKSLEYNESWETSKWVHSSNMEAIYDKWLWRWWSETVCPMDAWTQACMDRGYFKSLAVQAWEKTHQGELLVNTSCVNNGCSDCLVSPSKKYFHLISFTTSTQVYYNHFISFKVIIWKNMIINFQPIKQVG